MESLQVGKTIVQKNHRSVSCRSVRLEFPIILNGVRGCVIIPLEIKNVVFLKKNRGDREKRGEKVREEKMGEKEATGETERWRKGRE